MLVRPGHAGNMTDQFVVLQNGDNQTVLRAGSDRVQVSVPVSSSKRVRTTGQLSAGNFGASATSTLVGNTTVGTKREDSIRLRGAIQGTTSVMHFEGFPDHHEVTFAMPSNFSANQTISWPDESGMVITTGSNAPVASLNAIGDFKAGSAPHNWIDFKGYIYPQDAAGNHAPLLFDKNSDGTGLGLQMPDLVTPNKSFAINFDDGVPGTVLTTATLSATSITKLGLLSALVVAGNVALTGSVTVNNITNNITNHTFTANTVQLKHSLVLGGLSGDFTMSKHVGSNSTNQTGELDIRGQNAKSGANNAGGNVLLTAGKSGNTSTAGGNMYIDAGGYAGSSTFGSVNLATTSGKTVIGSSSSSSNTAVTGSTILSSSSGTDMKVSSIMPANHNISFGKSNVSFKLCAKCLSTSVYNGAGLILQGQSGHKSSTAAGGDVTVMPGAGGLADGSIVFANAAGVEVMSTTNTGVYVRQPLLLTGCRSKQYSITMGAMAGIDGTIPFGCPGTFSGSSKPDCSELGSQTACEASKSFSQSACCEWTGTKTLVVSQKILAKKMIAGSMVSATLELAESLDTATLLGSQFSNVERLYLGDDGAFTLSRTPRTSGSGTSFTIAGAVGAGNNAGGNTKVRPGNGTTDGELRLRGGSGNATSSMVVSEGAVNIGAHLVTNELHFGMNVVNTKSLNVDTVRLLANMSSPALVASVSVTTPAFDVKTLIIGSNVPFTLSRPNQTAGSANSVTLSGQHGASGGNGGAGGHLKMVPGSGQASGSDGVVLLKGAKATTAITIAETSLTVTAPTLITNAGLAVQNALDTVTASGMSTRDLEASEIHSSDSLGATSALTVGSLVSRNDHLSIGADATLILQRTARSSGAGASTSIVGQMSATNMTGGDLIIKGGAGNAGNGGVDMVVTSGNAPALSVRKTAVTVGVTLLAKAIDAVAGADLSGNLQCAGVELSSGGSLHAPTLDASSSVDAPGALNLISGTDSLQLGDGGAFTLQKSGGTGVASLNVVGQTSSGSTGGDVVIAPGSALNANGTHGGVKLRVGNTDVLHVNGAGTTVTVALLLQTGTVEATSLGTTGTMHAGHVEATTVVADAVTAPAVTSLTDTLHVGFAGKNATIMRANRVASSSATAFIVRGQASQNATGGDVVLRGGTGSTAANAGQVVVQDTTGAEQLLVVSKNNARLYRELRTASIQTVHMTSTRVSSSSHTSPAFVASVSLDTPALSSDHLSLGADAAFELRGANLGQTITLRGQAAGGSNKNGGDLLLQGGAGAQGGATELRSALNVTLLKADGTTVTTGAPMSVSGPITVNGTSVKAKFVGGSTMSTTSISAAQAQATGSISVTSVLSAGDNITTGGDTAFVLSRGNHSSSNAKATTIAGQKAKQGGANKGGNLVLSAGRRGSAASATTADGQIVLQDAQGNAALWLGSTPATVNASGSLLTQTLLLGASSTNVTAAVSRKSATDEAGHTYVLGQKTTAVERGGHLTLEGGTSGNSSFSGGGVHINAGDSPYQQGSSTAYGDIKIATVSGGVFIGHANSSTTVLGTLGVTKDTILTAIADSVTQSAVFGATSAHTLTRPANTVGDGAATNLQGQNGAASSSGGDLRLEPGGGGSSVVTLGYEKMVAGPLPSSCSTSKHGGGCSYGSWSSGAMAVRLGDGVSMRTEALTASSIRTAAALTVASATLSSYSTAGSVNTTTLTTAALLGSWEGVTELQGDTAYANVSMLLNTTTGSELRLVGQTTTGSNSTGGDVVMAVSAGASNAASKTGRIVLRSSGSMEQCNRNTDPTYSSCSTMWVSGDEVVFHANVNGTLGVDLNGPITGGQIQTGMAQGYVNISVATLNASTQTNVSTVNSLGALATLKLGAGHAFTLQRTQASSSVSSLRIAGQMGKNGSSGGDLVLRGGAKAGSNTGDGTVRLGQDSALAATTGSVTVNRTMVATQGIDAGSSKIETTGMLDARLECDGSATFGTATARALNIPVLLPVNTTTDSVALGSSTAAISMVRPGSSGNGTATTILGQNGANGGDIVLGVGIAGINSTTSGSIVLGLATGPGLSTTASSVNVTQPLTTLAINANAANISSTSTVTAATMTGSSQVSAATMEGTSGELKAPALRGVADSTGNYSVAIGDNDAVELRRTNLTSSQAGATWSIKGQQGASGKSGGDLVLKPGAAGGANGWDGAVVLSDASGNTVVNATGRGVTVGVQLSTSAISSGNGTISAAVAKGNTIVASSIAQSSLFTSRTSLTSAKVLGSSGVLLVGAAASNMTLQRTARSGGSAAKALTISGQAGANNSAGGDLVLVPGAGAGSGKSGTLALSTPDGGDGLRVLDAGVYAANSARQVRAELALTTQGINASSITTSASTILGTLSAPTVSISTAVATPSLLSLNATGALTFGGNAAFTLGKPTVAAANTSGSALTIKGAAGASGKSGGDLVLVGSLAVKLNSASGSTVLTLNNTAITVSQPLNINGNLIQQSHTATLTALLLKSATLTSGNYSSSPTIVAATSLTTPLVTGGGLDVDDNLKRTAKTSGAGSQLTIGGQTGAANSNGGDIILRCGSGPGSGTDGSLQLYGAANLTGASALLTVTASTISLTGHVYSTGTIDVGSSTLTAGGTMQGAVVNASSINGTTMTGTTSTSASVLNAGHTNLNVGADASTTVGRPTKTSGAGSATTISGQDAAANSGGSGGDLVLSGGDTEDTGGVALRSVGGSDLTAMGNRTFIVSAGAGMHTNNNTPITLAGTRVAVPSTAVPVVNDSITVYPTAEFLVLHCDDGDNANSEVFFPALGAGTNGQIIRIVNTGADKCAFTDQGPSIAATASKFRLQPANQGGMSYLEAGDPAMIMMYYYNSDSNLCINSNANTACIGGGWHQMVESPPTYCITNCTGDKKRWCEHEATHGVTGVQAVWPVDVDDDGDTDIVSASSSGAIAWYGQDGANGNSNGTKWTRVDVDTAATGASVVAVGNIRNSGADDIITATTSGSGTLQLYRDMGSNSNYSNAAVIATGIGTVTDLTIADMDGDNSVDDIVVVTTANIKWYKCASGDCTQPSHYTVTTVVTKSSTDYAGASNMGSANFAAAVIGDIDNDGDMDVASASSGDNSVRWHKNGGSGSSYTHYTVSNGAVAGCSAIQLIDMNGDGHYRDVVAASPTDGRVFIFENLIESQSAATAQWIQISVTSDAASVSALAIADVDGDGRSDIVATSAHALQYMVACGGGCTKMTCTNSAKTTEHTCKQAGASWSGDRGDSFSKYYTRAYCSVGGSYKTSSACTNAGGSWTGGNAAATVLSVADVTGDGQVDFITGNAAGAVGFVEQLRGTC